MLYCIFISILLLQASEIFNDTGDRAACYHLARQLENQDHIKEAITLYIYLYSVVAGIRDL